MNEPLQAPTLVEDYSAPGPLSLRQHWHALEPMGLPDQGGLVPEEVPFSNSPETKDSTSLMGLSTAAAEATDVFAIFTSGKVVYLTEEELYQHISRKTPLGDTLQQLLAEL